VDLIVADLSLPGMNGMELCTKLKANDATSHIPFVVIASSMSADVKMSCMKKGASQCVEMPFSMDYLKACIDNILENKSRVKTHMVQSVQTFAERSVNIVDRDEAFLEKFDALIMENISNPEFTVKEMEHRLGYSRSSFNRKINSLLGVSPNEYLRRRRLEFAAQMLGRKDSRISDICYKVGFNSPSYFAKCFKEQYGVLPADYVQGE
jgi:AraC-like DNA-binding protein